MTDFYAILGVPRTASSIEIRDAYLKIARDAHPDKIKGVDARKKAEDAFKNVTAAYDTLSKDRARRDYTQRLPAETKPKEKAPAPVSSPGPSPEAPKTVGAAPIPSTGRVQFDALAQGMEAFKKQDYHAAVQLLNLAVSNDEKNAKAHAMLSMALAKNPNWVRDALSHMETASRLDTKNVSYQVELALLLHSQGLKLRARRALEGAMAINPDHPDVARGLKEIPVEPRESEGSSPTPQEGTRGLFDRLRKR